MRPGWADWPGGTRIVISGSKFEPCSAVYIASVEVPVEDVQPGFIRLTTPAARAGTDAVDIVVVSDGRAATLPAAFVYQ